MPSVPKTRRGTTLKTSPKFRPLDLLRAIAASWRGGAPFQRQILNGMQDGRSVYAGTATETVAKRAKKAKRRTASKAARRSRRINRLAAKR